jgi:hypothetical protein
VATITITVSVPSALATDVTPLMVTELQNHLQAFIGARLEAAKVAAATAAIVAPVVTALAVVS